MSKYHLDDLDTVGRRDGPQQLRREVVMEVVPRNRFSTRRPASFLTLFHARLPRITLSVVRFATKVNTRSEWCPRSGHRIARIEGVMASSISLAPLPVILITPWSHLTWGH